MLSVVHVIYCFIACNIEVIVKFYQNYRYNLYQSFIYLITNKFKFLAYDVFASVLDRKQMNKTIASIFLFPNHDCQVVFLIVLLIQHNLS